MTKKKHAPNGPYPVCLHANESFVELAKSLRDELDRTYAACDFRYYPDPDANRLREIAAKHYGCQKENLTAGNGSDEIIELLFRSLCKAGEKILLFDPDFGVYRHAAGLQGLEIVSLPKSPGQGLDPHKTFETARKEDVRLILFSNPCNPTGALTKRSAIELLLKNYEGILVVDEAYMEFSDQSVIDLVEQYPNLIVLKTLSKAFGAAGLRIGFSISSPEIAEDLASTAPLYNVGRLSQELASCYFAFPEELEQTIARIKNSSDALYQGLKALETEHPQRLRVYSSAANFIYMTIDDAPEIYESLKRQGVLIRCFPPDALRVSAGSEVANQAFLDAFAQCLKEDRP